MVLDTQSQNIANYRRMNSEATRISSFGDISAVSGSKILDPGEQLLHSKSASLNEMTEAIIFWMQAHHGIAEFVQAQKEFQSLTGRVFHDDYFYHQRMSYFLDYFTFQRPVQGSLRENDQGSTPYQLFLDSGYLAQIEAAESVCQRFTDLASYRHSLFQIIKIAKNRMVLRDLYSKDKFDIHSDHNMFFQGFASASILQGFLFVIDGSPRLSQGVIIHPSPVSRIIKKSIKHGKKDHRVNTMQVLSKLAKQNLALVRHRNLEARKIYQQDPR